jgi:hypothetical protein
MTGQNSTPEVVGYCFVLRRGNTYVACVSVQHDEFHGAERSTYDDAVLEAREIVAMLRQERVITDSVFACLPSAS